MTKTFHILGLAHLPNSREYLSCAFTQKNLKLSKMLASLGHRVYLYGVKGNAEKYVNSENFSFIETHTVDDIARDYGDGDNRFEIGYNWKTQDYRHDLSGEKKPSTLKFYKKATEGIKKIAKEDHFILATQGSYHLPIVDKVGLKLNCESGIGYRGSSSRFYRCFESPYIQNFTYGSENPFQSMDGNYYDRVIPNYFDENEVLFSKEKDDYYLFIGRIIKRKGILTAWKACRELGVKLVVAGQGGVLDGDIFTNTDREFEIPAKDVEFIGFADLEKRKKLMAKARAVFVPTEYLECFAGVHIEAMLSGTPVITTDFGVFPYTIPDNLNGKIGFRCNTLQDFVTAGRNVEKLNPEFIREYAERFLMDNVKLEFDKWFSDLYQLYLSMDSTVKGWHFVSSN